MALPAHRTRAEVLVAHVEEAIDRRGLRPGDHIGTRSSLREESGVARATVNEAIRLLEERRRIVLRPGPGGGLFVAANDPVVRLGRTLLAVHGEPMAVVGAIEVREQLEPLIAAHAAQNRTTEDIGELEVMITSMQQHLDDTAKFVSINWELHARIAAISPNSVLRATYLGLYEFVNQVSLVQSQTHEVGYFEQRLRVHNDLVAAIIAGDVLSAQRAAEAHRHPN